MIVLAQMMDRGDMGDGGGGGHWWWWLIGIGLFALLVIAIVVVVNTTRGSGSAGPAPERPRSSAEDVLADRLARGEIDADEYRQRLTALRGG